MKKTNFIFLAIIISAILLAGCGSNDAEKKETTEEKESATLTEITFDDFFTKSDSGDGQITEKMQGLNGKKVGIMGYMTELTPIDNRFIYLVPTQGAACPFCSADNPKYLEAIAIYPPNGEEVPYTEDGLWIYGTLEVGEEVDEATGLISLFRLKAESIDIFQPR
jgi:hypothetical protein